MHIREWNNKVLGKSAIKKGGHFQEADPLNFIFGNYISQRKEARFLSKVLKVIYFHE